MLGFLNRKCVSDYKIPGTNNIIEKGIEIIIPVFGIQSDPTYYPEPKNFDPDRFNEERSTANRPYYAFGAGPRWVFLAI